MAKHSLHPYTGITTEMRGGLGFEDDDVAVVCITVRVGVDTSIWNMRVRLVAECWIGPQAQGLALGLG